VKRIVLPLAVAGLVAGSVALASPALAETRNGTSDQVVGAVSIGSGGKTATVQARYNCTGHPDQLALWVSVKQAAGGRHDPRLAGEGSSRYAAAWLQSHRAVTSLDCDGRNHVGTFTVDLVEPGSQGALVRGEAWVQFCLFDAKNPVPANPKDESSAAPVSSMRFVRVH
jgi:hypothetical protein